MFTISLLVILAGTAISMAAVDDCQELQFWNGTHCVQCSGCPRGFGVRTECSHKTDTECEACWPGYDYSNTTGNESCILCDTHSDCLPGNSKKIKNCTIFSGPVCDGCEEGNWFNLLVGNIGGCVECSPPCNILEEETRSCTTDHDRKCAAKVPVTSQDPSLDLPISNLGIEGRRFITQRLNGTYFDGYFYWQACAEKCDLRAECESWKNAVNPAEMFLRAYGEKAGSTIRKLVEVLKDPVVDLTQIATEVEEKFSPPQDQGENENVVDTVV